jgi:hypothetical protein
MVRPAPGPVLEKQGPAKVLLAGRKATDVGCSLDSGGTVQRRLFVG